MRDRVKERERERERFRCKIGHCKYRELHLIWSNGLAVKSRLSQERGDLMIYLCKRTPF